MKQPVTAETMNIMEAQLAENERKV